jgi:hypothetical protein
MRDYRNRGYTMEIRAPDGAKKPGDKCRSGRSKKAGTNRLGDFVRRTLDAGGIIPGFSPARPRNRVGSRIGAASSPAHRATRAIIFVCGFAAMIDGLWLRRGHADIDLQLDEAKALLVECAEKTLGRSLEGISAASPLWRLDRLPLERTKRSASPWHFMGKCNRISPGLG